MAAAENDSTASVGARVLARSNSELSPWDETSSGHRPDTPTVGRADRFQVVLHVDAEALRESSDSGQSVLDGTRVSAETSRRLACDASRVVMVHDGEGDKLAVGRRTRTVPPAIRRAVEHRDRGCRFPGCGLRFCDVHHIVHWADGGETTLRNTLLVCRLHHREHSTRKDSESRFRRMASFSSIARTLGCCRTRLCRRAWQRIRPRLWQQPTKLMASRSTRRLRCPAGGASVWIWATPYSHCAVLM